jgi:hypothetical protein
MLCLEGADVHPSMVWCIAESHDGNQRIDTANDVPASELEVEQIRRLVVVADFCWSHEALGTRRRHGSSAYIRLQPTWADEHVWHEDGLPHVARCMGTVRRGEGTL